MSQAFTLLLHRRSWCSIDERQYVEPNVSVGAILLLDGILLLAL